MNTGFYGALHQWHWTPQNIHSSTVEWPSPNVPIQQCTLNHQYYNTQKCILFFDRFLCNIKRFVFPCLHHGSFNVVNRYEQVALQQETPVSLHILYTYCIGTWPGKSLTQYPEDGWTVQMRIHKGSGLTQVKLLFYLFQWDWSESTITLLCSLVTRDENINLHVQAQHGLISTFFVVGYTAFISKGVLHMTLNFKMLHLDFSLLVLTGSLEPKEF